MNTANTTTQLRIPLRVTNNAAVIGPARTAIATRFTQRITKLPGLPNSSAVSLQIEGRTAVLQGKVASKELGDQIGRLALLEPGISDVRNELAVEPGLAQPETLPPAPGFVPSASP
jgi:hypothetical protein